jgi:RHS repeat-associated protein
VNGEARYGLGRLTSVEDHAGKRYFVYDVQGHQTVVAELRAGESCARLTRTSYDGAGRVLQLEYPTGRLLAYLYQGADPTVPSTIRTWVGAEQIDLVSNVRSVGGRVVGWHSWNGVENQLGAFLTGQGRLSRGSIDGADLSHREVTSLDPMGNPQRILGLTPATTEDFTYEPQMLTLASAQTEDSQSSAPYQAISYLVLGGLDGNRMGVSQQVPSTSTPDMCSPQDTSSVRQSVYTYDMNSSQLRQVAVTQTDALTGAVWQLKSLMDYSASGAMTQLRKYDEAACPSAPNQDCHLKSVVALGYDQEDELMTWTEDGAVNSYTYDSRHLRTRKTAAVGNVVQFWYGDDGQLMSEAGCADDSCVQLKTRDYVWLGGGLAAFVDAAAPSGGALNEAQASVDFVTPGLLREPQRVTDESGQGVWDGPRDPFGNVNSAHMTAALALNGNLVLNVGLPGMYQDDESGLWYNWHRHYGSSLGRYFGADPLLLGKSSSMQFRPPSVQAYTYALANPIKYIDPTGFAPNFAPNGSCRGDDDCKRECDQAGNSQVCCMGSGWEGNPPSSYGICKDECGNEGPFDPNSCPATWSFCKGRCVDTWSDPDHCGSCSNSCYYPVDDSSDNFVPGMCIAGTCQKG